VNDRPAGRYRRELDWLGASDRFDEDLAVTKAHDDVVLVEERELGDPRSRETSWRAAMGPDEERARFVQRSQVVSRRRIRDGGDGARCAIKAPEGAPPSTFQRRTVS
jgi:hypothetical protein